ncbi:elongation factor 1-alpha-like [Lineus longissimus]|uniref:elongation factor 1-alpha-like n=1 Tax=Lineus longissimus TaxID=88925 RepID=UPI002B4D8F60
MASPKPHLNLVVLGHTGAGKSTLIGHLLADLGDVGEETMAKVTRLATEAGRSDCKYAWLVNHTRGERERGLTIDVHAGHFETSKYAVNILDVPGHRDFLKNMIAGTSEADGAILLVSAARGQFKMSMKDDGSGMVPEHAMLAYTFGLSQIIVCVNKMDDKTVDHSQERFEKVKTSVQKHLRKINYKMEEVPFIPMSAWNGDNLTEKCANMAWWEGSQVIRTSGKVKVTTLTDAIDAMVIPAGRERRRPLRIPIRDMFTIKGMTVAIGRVESGQLKSNTKLLFGPTPGEGTAISIQKNNTPVECARPRDVIGMVLETNCINANRGRHGMYRRGQVCTDEASEPLKIVKEFIAQIVVLEHPKGIIHEGYAPIIDIHTSHVQCRIRQFIEKLDRNTGEVIWPRNPKRLFIGDAANVRMTPMKPMCAEQFRRFPRLGRFSMRDLSRVVGVGVITKITEYETVKSSE